MNPVLLLTHNNLALTKRCVESVHGQDIGDIFLMLVDNGSTDGTEDWIIEKEYPGKGVGHCAGTNLGVSAGWNYGLRYLFQYCSDHVLCVGNDTMIPPSFYRTLLSVDIPFVTGVSVDSSEQAFQPPVIIPLTPNPDFSAFLIRREAWEKIGPFDQRMVSWASDCDYHLRGHRLGVPMMKASVPFYHERSSTLNLAPPQEQAELLAQADRDRKMFEKLHGVVPGTPEYMRLFDR